MDELSPVPDKGIERVVHQGGAECLSGNQDDKHPSGHSPGEAVEEKI